MTMSIETNKAAAENRNVVVGIRFDGHPKELLDWALMNVANTGDTIVALNICRNSNVILKNKSLLDGCLVDYEGLCKEKQVNLTAKVMKGSSIKKLLVREAKNLSAVAVVLGIHKRRTIGKLPRRAWFSISKYCARRLPPTTHVIAIHQGKASSSNSQLAGLGADSKLSYQSEIGDSEISEMGRFSNEVSQSSKGGCRDGSWDAKDENWSYVENHKKSTSLSSISPHREDLTQQRPGWPLLRLSSSMTQPTLEARNMSVVQWVMSLPNRSLFQTRKSQTTENDAEDASVRGNKSLKYRSGNDNICSWNELSEVSEHSLKINSPDCKRFSHVALRTSQFSQENLIGRGGSNQVYKAILPEGKPVAVKIMKSSNEAWNNFAREIDIMATLKHQAITPLLGISVKDDEFISVYDYFPKGNLEDTLHKKATLRWEVRFKLAVGIAEALNYLHNECPRPVIHRDVKSSNILLSEDLEPQLSDFGLAIWAPTTAAFLTDSDVVGTFGYLAPEYFMYGKVSDKIDVYAYGVVLLELLSGRKPIGFACPNGQESLVMWAKPKLESGDLESVIDPKLNNKVVKDQMQRMCLAAKLCLKQSARVRPKINHILKILKGEKNVNEEATILSEYQSDSENQEDNDDEVYPESSTESHISLALFDLPDTSTSFSSMDQSSPLSVEESLKSRFSRSSSLD